MASPSFPQKNGEPLAVETVSGLLRNGSLHEADRAGVAHAVAHLVSLGLIETLTAEYVRCADHRDPDYSYVRNRSCRGRIRIEDDADDDGDGLYCPECGRKVYPRGKARCRMVQVEVKPDGVAAFLEGLLKEGSLEPKQIAQWVWRVDTPRGEARLVVADYCGLEHVCRDWAAVNRACYVVVDAASCRKRFLPEPWLVWTRVADVVCGSANLADLLSSAAATVPASQVRASVPVYSAAARPVVLSASPQQPDHTEQPQQRPGKTWPDPLLHTVAKCWTTKDGTFGLSTKTQGRYDGKAEFARDTIQAKLMQLVCYQKWQQQLAEKERERQPKRSFEMTKLADFLSEIYPDDMAAARRDAARGDAACLKALLKRFRSLISDIRTKKLEPAGINPDILPALDIESSIDTGLSLRVAHVHYLDANSPEAHEASVDPAKLDYLRRDETS
jgi:hypothetical protein